MPFFFGGTYKDASSMKCATMALKSKKWGSWILREKGNC